MEEENSGPRIQASKIPKSNGRFPAMDYLKSYAPVDSPAFQTTVDTVYQAISNYYQHRKDVHWADCCTTLIKLADKERLHHPPDKVHRISTLVKTHRIANRSDLERYFVESLPRDEHGSILLPQVNMRHYIDYPTYGQMKLESLPTERGLDSEQVRELEHKVTVLAEENSRLKEVNLVQVKALELYEEKFSGIVSRLDQLEKQSQNQESQKKAFEAEIERLTAANKTLSKELTTLTARMIGLTIVEARVAKLRDDLLEKVWHYKDIEESIKNLDTKLIKATEAQERMAAQFEALTSKLDQSSTALGSTRPGFSSTPFLSESILGKKYDPLDSCDPILPFGPAQWKPAGNEKPPSGAFVSSKINQLSAAQKCRPRPPM